MPSMNRRNFLSTTAAALCVPVAALPVVARANNWQRVVTAAQALDQCRAILVSHSGREVLAEVFRGPAIDQSVPIKSVSKTLVAALTGASIDRGEIPSVSATLGQLIPDLIPSAADPKVATISVENLLTMQAGLERTSGKGYGAWVASNNWVANALSRPMVAEPGDRMLYSTGSSHVMGAVLSELTGKSLLTLARERLGQPLGVEIPAWTRDPQGRYLGGNEMALTLRAMLRFGEMYRNEGRSAGGQVLSKDWVTQSMVPVTRSVFSGLGYGYGWFVGQRRGITYSLARGYGGQIICIVPKLELTIVITSDPKRVAKSAGYFGDLLQLIEDEIMPVVQA